MLENYSKKQSNQQSSYGAGGLGGMIALFKNGCAMQFTICLSSF